LALNCRVGQRFQKCSVEVCLMQAEIIYFPPAESDMALNDQDRAWIREQIRTALHERGFGQKLKEWVPITAIVAIVLFVATQWTTYVEFRTKTGDRLDVIEKTLSQISASLELLKPHAGSTLPQVMKNSLLQDKGGLGLKTVAALASNAQEQKVAADPKQVAAVGNQLVSTTALFTGKTENPEAWNTLAKLLSYYTALGVPPQVAPTNYDFPPGQYDFGYPEGGGKYDGKIGSGGGLVPIAEAALAEHIVEPKRNPNINEAPRFVIFQADPSKPLILTIDYHHLRNIVLVGATVEYHGGPVILENVYFVNCQIRLAQQQRCISFSESLFASNPVNFKTAG